MVSSALIWMDKDKYLLADPLCTMIFAFLGFCFSVPTVRDIFRILLLVVPDSVNVDQLKLDIMALDDRIEGLHCFHLWTINVDVFAMTCHIATRHPDLTTSRFLQKVQAVCQEHNIEHSVVQIELVSEIEMVEHR